MKETYGVREPGQRKGLTEEEWFRVRSEIIQKKKQKILEDMIDLLGQTEDTLHKCEVIKMDEQMDQIVVQNLQMKMFLEQTIAHSGHLTPSTVYPNRIEKTKKVTVRIEPKVIDSLDRIAVNYGMTRSDIIRGLVFKFVKATEERE